MEKKNKEDEQDHNITKSFPESMTKILKWNFTYLQYASMPIFSKK